jgi:hypothetical protein
MGALTPARAGEIPRINARPARVHPCMPSPHSPRHAPTVNDGIPLADFEWSDEIVGMGFFHDEVLLPRRLTSTVSAEPRGRSRDLSSTIE